MVNLGCRCEPVMIPVRRKINVYNVSMCYTSTAWATNTNTLDSSNVQTLHPPPPRSLSNAHWLNVAPPVFGSLRRWTFSPALGDTHFSHRVLLTSLLTPTSLPLKPHKHMDSFTAQSHNSFNKFISSLVAWQGSRDGSIVCVCLCCVVCVCLVDNAFTPMTRMHYWRCMCVCAREAWLSTGSRDCKSLTDAHHI